MKGSVSVLVVDDDRMMRSLILRTLQAFAGRNDSPEVKIETASSPCEALVKLRRFDADCIVSDLQMEPMDGIGFAAQIAEMGKDIPVLLITGAEITAELRAEARERGRVTAILEKGRVLSPGKDGLLYFIRPKAH